MTKASKRKQKEKEENNTPRVFDKPGSEDGLLPVLASKVLFFCGKERRQDESNRRQQKAKENRRRRQKATEGSREQKKGQKAREGKRRYDTQQERQHP